MNHPEVILVLARARNGIIGADGRLPWHIPQDMRRFKQITMGKPMIMGHATFDSLPGLLPGRRHIVLTRSAEWDEEGAEPVGSFDEALKRANAPHVAVIGGAEIFRLALPHADRVELTEVQADYEGDAYVDPFDSDQWREVGRESHEGDPAFAFVTLIRRGEDGA